MYKRSLIEQNQKTNLKITIFSVHEFQSFNFRLHADCRDDQLSLKFSINQ